MKKKLLYLCFLLFAFGCKKQIVADSQGPVILKPIAVVDTSRASWWDKARFGMFIHWGVYSVPAGIHNGEDISQFSSPHFGSGEWIMHNLKIPVNAYKYYASQFNPTSYNPDEWVQMAKEAGMKYIVITTKHHDGFALYDTKFSDWNVVKATPYGKDLIRPLVESCRKYGMKIGFYYSQANDWVNKGGAAEGGHWDLAQDGSMDSYIDKVAEPQIRELLTNYGDVCELWWDFPTDMTDQRAAKFTSALALQPKMLTNDRLGGSFGGDFDTPEQRISASNNGRRWESCMTMNDSWGFTQNDNNWKSSKTLIHNLIQTASLGGNYLLNVGPQANGVFPQPIKDRLHDIGKWMKVNGEAIYETQTSPILGINWGRATIKDMKNGNYAVYLFVYDWPASGKLLVPGLTNKIVSAEMLANGIVLKSSSTVEGIIVNVPKYPVDEVATVVKLEISGKPIPTPYAIRPEADGSIILYPGSAYLHISDDGSSLAVEGDGEDGQNIGYWSNPECKASWQILVDKPGLYQIETSFAAEGGPASVLISAGGNSVKINVPVTGSYTTYEPIVSEIYIAKPGLNTITLSADPEGWSAVNARKITLRPK